MLSYFKFARLSPKTLRTKLQFTQENEIMQGCNCQKQTSIEVGSWMAAGLEQAPLTSWVNPDKAMDPGIFPH